MLKKMIVLVVSTLTCLNVNAWDNRVTGYISSFEVHSPSSSKRHVTIALKDNATLCTLPSNNETAYLIKSDSPETFEVFISTLLTAKTADKQVKLYINHGEEGCRIDRVNLL